MKKFKIISSVLLVASILFFILSCKTTIDVSTYTTPKFSKKSYPINQEVTFSLSIIETGFAKTPEAFVYRGGNLFKTRKLSHVSVLIQHPKGTFAFDTGLGSEIKEQFHDNFSFIDRQLFKFTKLKSMKEMLVTNKFNPDSIDFIIPSHLHFDHASGIKDFPNATVWTTREEYNHAISKGATPPAFIKEQYNADFIKWKFLDFSTTEYEIFKESYDVFNDGTVVLVKLPGHTKGSLGMFVNLKSGKRYFFTGDLTWAVEAFNGPSEKHAIPRRKVDGDRENIKKTIVMIHHLIKEKPNLKVIPAHDFNAQKNIAHFPNVEW
ncbi:MBL fold metallo-hydrolase [uncultured Maribacter sp.]|uniref:MBL fold metallo-hydrolase n=1 Tax=uncultured Maribacter sp. TaxID=431308 RepID=UPI00262FAF4E|nr:MBL fold metallo-hydrolase [uncultured Maribacter sp.]